MRAAVVLVLLAFSFVQVSELFNYSISLLAIPINCLYSINEQK